MKINIFTADQIASACEDADIKDSQFESLMISLHHQQSVARRAASVPAQAGQQPYGWQQHINGVKTQNFARDEKELESIKSVCRAMKTPGVITYLPLFAAPVPAASVQPDIGRDAALVAAATALAWKWHRDAVKDGFACSEPAQELFEVLGWPADAATQPAPEVASVQPVAVPLTHEQIRQIFMASGFTIKEGQTDLKDYVYKAAYALIKAAAPSAPGVQVRPKTLADKVAEWENLERISNIPGVHEALKDFSEDPTGDNGCYVIQEIMKVAAPAQPAEPNQQDAVDPAPNLRNVYEVTRVSDQSVRVMFASCRAASEFERYLLARTNNQPKE